MIRNKGIQTSYSKASITFDTVKLQLVFQRPRFQLLDFLNFIFSKFGQIYTAFMYNKEWLMFTDGRKYQIEDALGDEVTAQATDNGEMIEISTTGGSTGPMVTRISLEAETNRLQFELELTDLKVKALRYFEPV